MRDPFEIIRDESWKTSGLPLGDTLAEIAIKRCGRRELAAALVEEFHLPVSACGGAIIIGASRPIESVTVEELMQRHKYGPIPKAPFWIEVVLFRRITFERMLDYITSVGYGNRREGFNPAYNGEQVRKKAYELLKRANVIGPMCFNGINDCSVSVRYLKPFGREVLDPIIEDALAFNEEYFRMQLRRAEWKRQYRSSNGFALGPC